MTALEIVGIIFAAGCIVMLWRCLRVNRPQTPEEERAQWEQDLKDFDADMASNREGFYVYKQPTAPRHAKEGDVWFDCDECENPSFHRYDDADMARRGKK